jgi:hypothetical protein
MGARSLNGMHFSEPITALTDYVLGATSFLFGLLLWKRGPKRISTVLWSLGFFSSCIAAIVGGTYHALKVDADAFVLRSMWNVTIFFIGAGGAFMVSGVLAPLGVGHTGRKWLLKGLWVTLAGLAIQQSRLQLSSYFNHNDVFHCTQILAFYYFFRGARVSEDRELRD